MKTSLTLFLMTVAFTSLTALRIETTTENSSDTFPTTKNPAVDQPCDSGTWCIMCNNSNCYGCWGPDSRPKESECPKKNFPWLLVIAGQALIVICLVAYKRRIHIRNDPERQPLI